MGEYTEKIIEEKGKTDDKISTTKWPTLTSASSDLIGYLIKCNIIYGGVTYDYVTKNIDKIMEKMH